MTLNVNVNTGASKVILIKKNMALANELIYRCFQPLITPIKERLINRGIEFSHSGMATLLPPRLIGVPTLLPAKRKGQAAIVAQ